MADSETSNDFVYTGVEEIPVDITSVKLAGHINSIGRPSVFSGCVQLKVVILNEGLRTIQAEAFKNCRELEGINFPSTLREIGDEAFINCENLKTLALNEGLRTIGNDAFEYCLSLDNIRLPTTLNELG